MMNKPIEYILGLPMETSAGMIQPLKVKEFDEYATHLTMMAMDKTYIIYQYAKMNKKGDMDEFINKLVERELFEIVMAIPDFTDSYIKMFEKSFEEEKSLELISYENFTEIRNAILEINCMSEEKAFINLNKEDEKEYLSIEIQQAIERSKRVKNQSVGESPQIEDIISSIVVATGINYPVIADWTMYQLYMTHGRIGQFKNYDTTTLFATVAADGIEIESWSKRIDLFEKEDHTLKKDKFDKQYGDIVS